jgi:uroporphyrinogen decarboxylase
LTPGWSCATNGPVSAPKLTPRQRIENLLRGQPADRTPFCPAVYEHKAALIGVSPSTICRDADLFEKAMIREVEVYDPDMLVVGCDVYNVEAEATGCEVTYPETNDVPAVKQRILEPGGDLSRLQLPDPRRGGRMPLSLEVARRIQLRFGGERIVRGALSAPFSIASQLVGPGDLLIAMLDDAAWTKKLLAFCAEIVKSYGRAFAERGVGVILFDSYASPPMTYPELYRRIILSPTAEVIRFFRRELGISLVPYIMGGDTTVLLEQIIKTGTNNILCDYKADLNFFVGRLMDEPVLLRANISPALIATQPVDVIKARVRQVLAIGRRHPRFLMGTGILSYDTAPDRVIAVREVLEEEIL